MQSQNRAAIVSLGLFAFLHVAVFSFLALALVVFGLQNSDASFSSTFSTDTIYFYFF